MQTFTFGLELMDSQYVTIFYHFFTIFLFMGFNIKRCEHEQFYCSERHICSDFFSQILLNGQNKSNYWQC